MAIAVKSYKGCGRRRRTTRRAMIPKLTLVTLLSIELAKSRAETALSGTTSAWKPPPPPPRPPLLGQAGTSEAKEEEKKGEADEAKNEENSVSLKLPPSLRPPPLAEAIRSEREPKLNDWKPRPPFTPAITKATTTPANDKFSSATLDSREAYLKTDSIDQSYRKINPSNVYTPQSPDQRQKERTESRHQSYQNHAAIANPMPPNEHSYGATMKQPQSRPEQRRIQNYPTDGQLQRYGYADQRRLQQIHQRPPNRQENIRGYGSSSQTSKPAGSSAWKSLWGVVEKGIDELSNVDQTISKRAQSLFSTYSAPKQEALEEQRGFFPTPDQQPLSRRYVGSKGKRQAVSPTTEPLTPFGDKYERAKAARADLSEVQRRESRRGNPFESITNGSSGIRTNGGAFDQPRQPLPPPQPYGESQSQNDSRDPEGNSQKFDRQGQTQSQNQSPFNPQRAQPDLHYRQQQGPAPTKPSEPISGLGKNSTSNVPNLSPQNANEYSSPVPKRSPYVQPEKDSMSATAETIKQDRRNTRIPWSQELSDQPLRSSTGGRPFVFDDDNKDDLTWKVRMGKLVPSFRSPLGLLRKRNNSYDTANAAAWEMEEDKQNRRNKISLFPRKKELKQDRPNPRASVQTLQGQTGNYNGLSPLLACIVDRSRNENDVWLLKANEERLARQIGERNALLDVISVGFLYFGVRQLIATSLESMYDFRSFSDLVLLLMKVLESMLPTAVSPSWAAFCFAAAWLTHCTRRALLAPRARALAESVSSTVHEEVRYSQLYLRLVAALPIDPKLSEQIKNAAYLQVSNRISASRLRAFIGTVIMIVIFATMTVVRSIVAALFGSLKEFFLLDGWRSWPTAFRDIGSSSKDIAKDLATTIQTLAFDGANRFIDNPRRFMFHLSAVASLAMIAALPMLERRRKIDPVDDSNEASYLSSTDTTTELSSLGISSASRLSLLSENGSVETALERWRQSSTLTADEDSKPHLSSVLRLLGYRALTAVLCLLPLVVYVFVQIPRDRGGILLSLLLDKATVALFVFNLASKVLSNAVNITTSKPAVHAFLGALSDTIAEIMDTHQSDQTTSLTAVSPTAGISVRDFWAAHTSKRAWAVRGANLDCKNGEILVVLGEDGSGKSRLLTSIAESIIFPTKRSLSSNKVRGTVSIGGIDATKWDRAQLKRRAGILLSDVRMSSDSAIFASGSTLEEILDPVDGMKNLDPSHKLSPSERSAVILGLKITGLYSSLLPKLPSKLSTVVTANEEDLQPSPLRPRYSLLSPSEWSKLLLSKVITQTIYDNDNSASSTDKIENCLIGSVLILDDPTVLMSEVEEASVLKSLRQTGAATILSSNKWAVGRFADRIVVVKDGAIVESGSHNELLGRGYQNSLYAAKWHAMTIQ